MQNLRDKLLKAGKISKKQKRQSDQGSRAQRKATGGHVQSEQSQAAREAAYAQKLAEDQARDKLLEDQRRAERQEREQRLRARHIIDYYTVPMRQGQRRWYFVAHDNLIKFIAIRDSDAYMLEQGKLAIIERIHDPSDDDSVTFRVVPKETAEVLWDMDDAYVRFFNRDDPQRPERWFEVARKNELAQVLSE